MPSFIRQTHVMAFCLALLLAVPTATPAAASWWNPFSWWGPPEQSVIPPLDEKAHNPNAAPEVTFILEKGIDTIPACGWWEWGC